MTLEPSTSRSISGTTTLAPTTVTPTSPRTSPRSLDLDPEAAAVDGNGIYHVSSRTSTIPATNGKEGYERDPFEVCWDSPGDPMCPLNTPAWRKWAMVAVLGFSCVCVTCTSSMASDTYPGMIRDFHVSEEVCVLSISLFVIGLGIGPLLLGPVSEFIGRAPVLRYGFAAFFLLGFPVAFGPLSVHLIFRFLTGFAGSAFLSVSGGAITDVFENTKVATPMMIFSAAPFIGPVLGPLISGFINSHVDWRWTYYVILIWSAVMTVLIFVLVPETYDPQLLVRKAKKTRKATGDDRHFAPIERRTRSFTDALKHSIKTPFILLTTQGMVLMLNLWSAIILGILYLMFGGLPWVFSHVHGFDMWQTGMSFLGIGLGMLCAAASQPYFNKQYRAIAARSPGGIAPPESRLIVGMYGAVLAPLGILLVGVTAFKDVHWIVPIILSLFFGMGVVFAFTSTFTYLVDAYRPVAASALASNSFLRSSFAAGFPLFGRQLYNRLGAVGGTCLLAGLLFLCTPMPFVFYKIGARVRAKSTFAHA